MGLGLLMYKHVFLSYAQRLETQAKVSPKTVATVTSYCMSRAIMCT